MLKLKILIAEEDDTLLQLYSFILKEEGFLPVPARSCENAWEILTHEHIDLTIINLELPVMGGCRLLSMIRTSIQDMPVLVVSSDRHYSAKQKAYHAGADDFMEKPVNPDEMLLHIHALLRRCHLSAVRRLELPHTLLDCDALAVTVGNEEFMLPQKEFDLLFKLLSHPDQIISRQQLMDEIWGQESSSSPQTIDVHINRLRKRFHENPDFTIVTARGLGYKAVLTPSSTGSHAS